MSSQRTRTKHFADFTGGEWGDIGQYQAGDNMFTARNMIVTEDGCLCPRAGLKDRAVTGLPNGVVWGMGYAPVPDKQTWLIVDDKLYYGVTSFSAATGTLTSDPTDRVNFNESTRLLNFQMYFATNTSGLWQWNTTTNAIAQMNSQNGTDVELYKDRLYLSGSPGFRVYYSDAADFTTWGAGSYFDVGYQFPPQRILSQRNTLQFLTDEYQWELSGVPESTSVLRRVATAVPAGKHGAMMSRDVIHYVPATRSAPVIYRSGLADENSLRRLEWTTGSLDDAGCAANIFNDDLVFVSEAGDDGLTRYNGVWTMHDFETTVTGLVSRFDQDSFQLCDGGGASQSAELYYFNCHPNRPAFTSDTKRSPGDASSTPVTAHVYLPEEWDQGGQLRKVRQVIVDFVSYNTGTTETAHFDMTVEAHHRPNQTGSDTSDTQSFDEAVSSSSTSGTQRRIEFNIGDQGWAGGYQVKFDAVRSLKIQGVHVVYDEQLRDTR